MDDLVIINPMLIPASTVKTLCQTYDIEAVLLALNPDDTLPFEHRRHAGMYARTIKVPKGIMITGVLIKIPTIVVVHGDCYVTLGDKVRRLTGYHVLSASAGRKQMFRAIEDTHITMLFPTSAQTVAEAEEEFTDEAHLLQNRRAGERA